MNIPCVLYILPEKTVKVLSILQKVIKNSCVTKNMRLTDIFYLRGTVFKLKYRHLANMQKKLMNYNFLLWKRYLL